MSAWYEKRRKKRKRRKQKKRKRSVNTIAEWVEVQSESKHTQGICASLLTTVVSRTELTIPVLIIGWILQNSNPIGYHVGLPKSHFVS